MEPNGATPNDDAIQEPESRPAGDATKAPSPFGPRALKGDRGIQLAIYGLLVAILVVGGYLAWAYFGDIRLAQTQSPTARAVANLSAMVAKAPDNAQARVQLAEAMMANGQSGDAIEQLQEALRLEKDNVQALTDLGLIAMDRAEWKKAEGYWLQLVQLLSGAEMAQKDQRLSDVYYYLGTTLVEQQRYEEAVANLKQSIAIKRDSSPVHYMLSVAYARLALPDMQRQELEIVVAFDPTQAQANFDLGMLQLTAGDVASAAEFFRISADSAPKGINEPADQLAKLGDAETRMASALRLKSSNPKKALSEARIAAALDPKDPEAVSLVAQLFEKTGDPVRAKSAWERLLVLVPGDATATAEIKRLSENEK